MALSHARRLALGAALLGLGCSKPDPAPRRTEPWLATPSASGSTTATSAPRVFQFTSESSIEFSVTGKKGKITGHIPVARGELRIDPRDLKQTRAELEVDLTRLVVETSAPDDFALGASTPTARALEWLELGGQVPAERRAQFATARYELHSLENLSSSFLGVGSKAAPVRAAAVGTLLLHGFRAPVRAEVQLRTVAPNQARERVSIRSVSALVVPLGPHEITARDPSGVVDALGAAHAADWVGKTARVEFELIAESASK